MASTAKKQPDGSAALDGDVWLPVTDIAKRWKCGTRLVRRMIQDGELLAIDLASSSAARPTYRVTLREVEKAEKRRQL